MSVLLDQNKNYNAQFGPIFRSSAIFYIPRDVKTTITVSNYWDFKNNLEVGLLFSIRKLSGELVERRELYFNDGLVINESKWPIEEGSVEVEAFGNKNLRIPYAAVMGVYETEASITMVHSYGRNHNLIEIEDRSSLTSGRESCWTIRQDNDVENKAVFHNGHLGVPNQIAKFTLTNVEGAEHSTDFSMPLLEPFETFVFNLSEIVPQYKDFLSGSDGWGTLHFENKTAFTRLLLVWQNKLTGELQVTHSNFDYSEIETNKIEATKPAIMKWPSILTQSDSGQVVLYPKFSKGIYKITSNKSITETDKGLFIKTKDIDALEFTSLDKNTIPSRIVTGITYQKEKNTLPLECSMGIVHEKRPPKRFHWAVVSKKFKSRLFFNAFTEIYQVPDDLFIVFRLYTAKRNQYVEKRLDIQSLNEIPDGIYIDELFANIDQSGHEDYCYVSMFSNFGGLLMYSSMQKKSSMTIEHSF
tara:strand:+ start:93212 stop:94624 length:1413 start_codon:yes stop_codon:yes gene_type:complete